MLPLRIYNNKAVIGNLGIPIHLGSNEKLTLDCICLAQFRSALLTTLSAIEEVLLLTSYQTMSTRNKIGATHHTEGNSRYKLFDKSWCVWWLDWLEGLFILVNLDIDQGRKTLLEFTRTHVKDSRGDLLKYYCEATWILWLGTSAVSYHP